MLPFHLNQASTVQYMAERDGDHGHPSPFTIASDASPFRPCPILFNSSLQNQRDRDHCHIQHYPLNHQASEKFFSSGTSNRLVSNALMDEADDEGDNLKLSLCDHYVKEEHKAQTTSKWMSSKMRIMKKMMKSNLGRHVPIIDARPSDMQAPQDRSQRNMQVFGGASNDNNSTCGIIRVCSDCHTTKTPLWRSGPCGPKSLCNACGIRQRKARRAMAAAAVSGGLLPPHHATPMKVRKEKKLDVVDRTMPFKKRYKIATASSAAQAKLCFEDVTLSLNTSSTFDRVFPQDERDAAILLMALSCGLIRS